MINEFGLNNFSAKHKKTNTMYWNVSSIIKSIVLPDFKKILNDSC